MRDGWVEATIGEVAEQVRRPVAVESGVEYPLLGVRWYGQGPFLREVGVGGTIKATKLYGVQPGDFIYNRLFAWKGSFGVVGPELAGSFVSGEFPLFVADSQRVLPEYLNHVMCQPATWAQIERESTGSTATSRNRWKEERFRSWPIALPSPLDQRRVVDLIAAIDDGLRAAQNLIVQRQLLTRSLLHDLIERPDWPAVTLDDLLVTIEGGRSPVTEGRVPLPGERGVLKLSAVKPGRFHADETKALGQAVDMPEAARVRVGDVLITRSNTPTTVGAVCHVDRVRADTFLSDLTLRLVPTPQVLPTYLALALNTDRARSQIVASASGTSESMRKISRGTMRRYVIPVPPPEEQTRIAALLDSSSATVALAAQQERALNSVRSCLLADLLSGAHEIPASYDALLERAS